MALDVLLICWPPAPEERKVSMRRSFDIQRKIHLLGLRHHRHGGGGGLDAALTLGLGHPLDAVDTALKLEAVVGSPRR